MFTLQVMHRLQGTRQATSVSSRWVDGRECAAYALKLIDTMLTLGLPAHRWATVQRLLLTLQDDRKGLDMSLSDLTCALDDMCCSCYFCLCAVICSSEHDKQERVFIIWNIFKNIFSD